MQISDSNNIDIIKCKDCGIKVTPNQQSLKFIPGYVICEKCASKFADWKSKFCSDYSNIRHSY